MKYNVYAFYNEKKYESTVSVRIDANWMTTAKRCVNAIIHTLINEGAIPNKQYHYQIDPPNIWRNGAFASAWMCKPFIDIYAEREDGLGFLY